MNSPDRLLDKLTRKERGSKLGKLEMWKGAITSHTGNSENHKDID